MIRRIVVKADREALMEQVSADYERTGMVNAQGTTVRQHSGETVDVDEDVFYIKQQGVAPRQVQNVEATTPV